MPSDPALLHEDTTFWISAGRVSAELAILFRRDRGRRMEV